MKIKKHGNKYMITYRLSDYEKPFSEYFDSAEAANLRIAQIELDKKLGTVRAPKAARKRKHITVAQLMEDYVNLYGVNQWSVGTLSDSQHRIKHYILPYIGEEMIEDLTTLRLEEYYNFLLTQPAISLKGRENGAKISPSVVERVHVLLRSALNQAIRWGYLQGANPALVAKLPAYRKKKREVWSEQEAKHALEVCTDSALKLAILLALGCSMRIGEILGLTWDCVHMDDDLCQDDNAYLTVNKELRRCQKDSLDALKDKGRGDIFYEFSPLVKKNCSTVLVLKAPKTESSIRNIYLPSTVISALKAAQAQQEQDKADLGPEYQDFNMVLAQPSGRPYEEHIITAKLRDLIETNNLKPVVFHSLRHSSTSLKLKLSGGDIKAVQGDTGHAQSNMVTDVYSHIMDEDRKRLAQKVDSQFFGVAPQKNYLVGENAEVKQLLDLLNSAPELASPLLQMTQIMRVKSY
jgi:integrase